ncbi:TPA: sigma-54-dependent Fis family transcriptional regulator [Campylobacter fetus subsp. venerealis]|uniref:Flagella-associated two-component system, response regulator n=1 Tax=Campylobacter fetus subsp. venerealis NCTC 10354 TaxID=983328 RepID=A0AAE6MB05_CAMFE|nr:sigma-54 dependent transcriptional regulator [Campylobacter fetus]OCS22166.1 AAA family ATPase [Campylobacter fetus subsp. venerealis cfvi97/532]OCS26987.1 AAA family ATPase [Campylobacter fetus subsp. venerealis cfvB10]OCS30120.1 AAA family ATPase [Campylobacter fetus subsp. venerealis LMG 6570 = CCUG 33900]OCS43342.1 AAA family ATPase [Campylobacter fetus subsp. venerealis cfvi02/298]AHE94781.1 sigma54-dependent response regulator [Campylobacter fetus subsp. venerealis cfvi03/293]
MNVVIVEDDINMRKSLEIALGDYDEFNIKSYKSATEALKKLEDNTDIIVTDINMPGIDGLEFIKELGGKFDVIIMTGNATLNRAIQSVRLGVKDFLTKPFDVETLVTAIKRTKTLSSKQSIKQDSAAVQEGSFLSTSPNLQKALNIAKRAAITDVSVMIMGESGVGKELFSKFIHENSKRKNEPFMAINMAAIPENLLESELYGYEKGAFTDATATKKGLFELANGGTLFLDEIGEMPLNLQPKLLRAIQEREIVRVGASKPIKIDVRIISATNANLEKKVKEGEFREDLFYRLNTVPLFVPPLRERKDEILGIANSVLQRVCIGYELGEKSFSDEAMSELLGYDYPGNIRELISIVERAAILSEQTNISKDDLFIYAKR